MGTASIPDRAPLIAVAAFTDAASSLSRVAVLAGYGDRRHGQILTQQSPGRSIADEDAALGDFLRGQFEDTGDAELVSVQGIVDSPRRKNEPIADSQAEILRQTLPDENLVVR